MARSQTLTSGNARAAQARAFAMLELVVGTAQIEAPSTVDMMAMAPAELDRWLFARYRSAFTSEKSVDDGFDERAIAGLVHQDLQFARWSLEGLETKRVRTGLRVAAIANLYAGLLKADPRLSAAIHEGFLLPGSGYALADGMAAKGTIYEGAANSFRSAGRDDRWRDMLRQLLDLQTGKGNLSGADMARVHLSNALVSQADDKAPQDLAGAIKGYDEGIFLLTTISTIDLLGAKKPIPQLKEVRDRWSAQLAQGPLFPPANGNPGNDNADRGNGDTAGGNAGAGGQGGAAGAPTLPGFGMRIFDNGGNGTGNGAGNAEIENAATQELDAELNPETGAAPKTKLEQAIDAARVADRISRQANLAATVALAKLLDAQDAQQVLDEALGIQAAQRNTVNPAGTNRQTTGAARVSEVELARLKAEALFTKRAASEAAERAATLLKSAQVTAARAARLAVMAHSATGATKPDTAAAATRKVKVEVAPINEVPIAVDLESKAKPLVPAEATDETR